MGVSDKDRLRSSELNSAIDNDPIKHHKLTSLLALSAESLTAATRYQHHILLTVVDCASTRSWCSYRDHDLTGEIMFQRLH